LALQEQADELFNQFNFKNLDAMIRLMKTVLENIRKRVLAATKSIITYGNVEENEEVKKDIPVFKTYAILATPNLIIQPSVDEMQQSLNKCIQNVDFCMNMWE
jgi:dynein heavy chain